MAGGAPVSALPAFAPLAAQPPSEEEPPPVPLVIEGSRGPLIAFYYAPHAGVPPIGDLLVVPPFVEEMNRCRAMVALQARRLAHLGAGTLVLDPYGTGDSAGEFVEATWAQWRDDLAHGIEWLERCGQGCVALWGIRLGALMAAQLAREHPSIRRLLLWQPVFDGKGFYTQFLRIRIAAELHQANRVKGTGELRQKSAAGEVIEVSGYEIGPALAAELDSLAVDPGAFAAPMRCEWLEVRTGVEEQTMLPASQRLVEKLRDGGAALTDEVVTGPPFWHVHQRELAPQLIDVTCRRVAVWGARERARVAPAPPPTSQEYCEHPLVMRCGADWLSGVMHRAGGGLATRGVVIVVAGGPQYRAGAHRQFVQMARRLAGNGWPVVRFDLRGMGDSTGTHRGFTDSLADLRAAVDTLMEAEPQLREVVMIGECASASGILFYAFRDPRVKGAVLTNPWLRTPEGRAQVIVKTYYLERLRQREFWNKLRRGEFDFRASLASLVDVVRAYLRGRLMFARSKVGSASEDLSHLPLPERVATGLARFQGQVLLLMSGHDYIADEFDEVVAASRAWDGLLESSRVVRHDVEGADHTFSRRAWKEDASSAVVDWMRRW